MNEAFVDIDPSSICKDALCDFENFMIDIVIEEWESSKEKIQIYRDDGSNVSKEISINTDDLPQSKTSVDEDEDFFFKN